MKRGQPAASRRDGTRGRAHPLADKACARTVPGSLLPPGLFLLAPLSGTLFRAAPSPRAGTAGDSVSPAEPGCLQLKNPTVFVFGQLNLGSVPRLILL